MKVDIRCRTCILEWTYGRAICAVNNRQIPELMKDIGLMLAEESNLYANIALLCNRAVEIAYRFVTSESYFWEELKRSANSYVQGLLPRADAYIREGKSAKERFERACFLAAAGNVAPMGVPSIGFTFDEARAIMEEQGPFPVIIGDAYETSRNARTILYLVDNAGEIGFDGLLIRMLKEMGLKVTIAVKKSAFFEDAIIEDAIFL
ncbi:MAG: hypothetical protein C0392_12565, partial [Syntrophus sp. (in: bacteria)]|nr:hypothetical protein [Syntrophus sp. (in: bacteria)]